MKIIIENEKAMSWNQIYQGRHWSYRQQEAQRVHMLVKAMLGSQAKILTTYPVDVRITAYFTSRPIDSDNVAAKMYLDGLKGLIIEDDSPKFVRRVTTESRIDKTGPRVEIEIG